jgi:hypothetical protein
MCNVDALSAISLNPIRTDYSSHIGDIVKLVYFEIDVILILVYSV